MEKTTNIFEVKRLRNKKKERITNVIIRSLREKNIIIGYWKCQIQGLIYKPLERTKLENI